MNRTLLRGARVITMAPHRPDVERADILIDGDCIAAVGPDLDDPAAETVDFSDRIVLPGLVNAHLHTWQTALRGVGADWTLAAYLAHMHGDVARKFTPDDMHIATLAGALSQINCGTTTLGDWCHNNPTPDHTDAAVDGLLRSGIRGVYLHGTPYVSPSAAHPVHEVDRLLDGPVRTHDLLTVGMAVRGPQLSTPEVAVADFRAARERDIIVSTHQSVGIPGSGWQAVRAAGLLGPRTNVVHGAGLSEDWVQTLIEAGASFTCTPENELGQGHGAPITARLLPLGAAPSLGTDTDAVVPGDVLTAARIALAHQRGLDHDRLRQSPTGQFTMEPTISGKQALAWATVEGARALGLADQVGRIEPGMQADLVVVDGRRLNLWPVHDPIAAALHAGVGDIEAVMIAGRWRKRDHILTDVDIAALKEELQESGDRLARRLSRTGPVAGLRRRIVRRVVRQSMIRQIRTPGREAP
ncbi:amidohydrolase family protein [Kutzneria buriramensis]|uniref:Cytosine/adenosine deaminase-related metal-dependent hydrolase n=1 Tax=Kutzneria buriramensis TaxID=1045776 RepID=A0A3E0H1E7_9PSEU|nr:amidohydrolase family protein [Kutzneria buriramensis]REH35656.1 cytosine/adenosine deaminase-related metal-dependent hydrolase [Kutzneria buriramensis]